MARIAYGEAEAAAFAATRHLDRAGLAHWEAAIRAHLRPTPGQRVLDLGSGTGMWASAFTDWYGVEVVAIEPSAAMRARSIHPGVRAGHADALPLKDASMDAAWLSTVIHHFPDLPAAAAELRRVLRPGAPVLIRAVFAGRHDGITQFRYFTEAIRVVDTFPTVADVTTAFGAAGFELVALDRVSQATGASLAQIAANMTRAAHSPLQLITDEEYAAGLARMRAAASTETGPVVDSLDLLVLR